METFADLISSPTPVLVDVFAEWCAPCKIMAGILKKVKETQGDSLRIIKIDIDEKYEYCTTLCNILCAYTHDFQKRKTVMAAKWSNRSKRTK